MSLLEQVKEAGVIGAGGAGFPTHAKLNCKAEYILMNGAECEPLLRVDQQLMALYPDEIIKGFKAAGELVGAKKANTMMSLRFWKNISKRWGWAIMYPSVSCRIFTPPATSRCWFIS